MKKLIIVLICIPFLCFSQSTKTDKVLNDVNTATTVIGNVINIFKKDKNKDKSEPPKTNNENSASSASDGTFSVNAKPEDIVSRVYKCTYKNFDEYTRRCVWKPTAIEINKLKQNSQDEYNDWLSDPKLMFAAEVADSALTFKQNGIDNIVVATTISSYSSGDKNASPGWANMEGFIRFQTTDRRQMKILNNSLISIEMGSVGGAEILKLDEDNVFYSIFSWEGGTASHDLQQQSIYSLNGDFLLSYITNFMSAGQLQESNEMKIDEVNKLIKIVEPRITTDKKGKVKKTTYKTVQTYQYGNGTIREIKQPTTVKKPAEKK